eukprot:PhF_6_TR31415/c3_g1_i1/m.46051
MVRAKDFFGTVGNPFSPYTMKSYFCFIFYGSVLLGWAITMKQKEEYLHLVNETLTDDEKEHKRRMEEFKRTPWPLLHQRITSMREGKIPYEGLGDLWRETQYYYPGDWLIPLELAQIVKYNNGRYLAQYVQDPEVMRQELLTHLINVKYGRVKGIDVVTDEIREILTTTIDDVSGVSLADTKTIPLAPGHHTQ